MTKMFIAALALAGLFAGAGRSTDQQRLTYLYVPFDQIDPQRVSDGQDIAGQDLLEGLVTPNAAGTGVVPATADRWSVSNNGTVYTFHIRNSATWSDGTPVTARDFEWTYKRLLTPSTSAINKLNGASGYPPDLGIRHALDFQLGTITDWAKVGIKALDASHLRIILGSPNASFLQELALPAMVALPEENLTKFPYSWQDAAHWVGNGPFVPQSWTPNETMIMVPNPNYWDRQHVHLDRVTIQMGSPTDAEIGARYEGGELDIARIGDSAAFAAKPALAQAITHVRKYSVNFLTLIPSRNPLLRDVRVREAIALAIDRTEVGKVSPSVEGSTSLLPTTLPRFRRERRHQTGCREGEASPCRRRLRRWQGLPHPLDHDDSR